jgi:hypothetical protein
MTTITSSELVRGTQWQPREDILLLEIIALKGTRNWKRIQEHFPGRTISGCRRRWYRLRESVGDPSPQKCPNCQLPFRSETRTEEETPNPSPDIQPLLRELLTPPYTLFQSWLTPSNVPDQSTTHNSRNSNCNE